MSNVNGIAAEISRCIEMYLKELDNFSEEVFKTKPSDKEWSLSELYCHITQANNASLVAIEKCFHSQQSGSTPFISRVILFFGRFPRKKYKAPEQMASIVKQIDKAEARNQMVKFLHRLPETTSKLLKTSAAGKLKHPRLGMLDAKNWFRFIDMHTKHHLKQLQSLKMKFAS